jgi:hypothetical protein
MTKNITYLGVVKLPWKSFFDLLKSKSTFIEHQYDSKRKNFYMNRTKKELKIQKEIVKKYPMSTQLFYRYTNKKFKDLIPLKLWKKFSIDKNTARVQVMRHTPGTVSLPHVDRYNSFLTDIGKDKSIVKTIKIKRIWITMTDPKLGQALFVGNAVAYWLKKGTALTFNHRVYHAGCNTGIEDRYTLTITGWKNGQ